MKAGEIILDFIHFVLYLALIVFCIDFFILGNRMELAEDIVRVVFTFSLFGVVFLTKFKRNRAFLKKASKESGAEMVLYLTYLDKIKGDLIAFVLAFIVIVVALIFDRVGTVDVLQAMAVFAIVELWHLYLFKHKG